MAVTKEFSRGPPLWSTMALLSFCSQLPRDVVDSLGRQASGAKVGSAEIDMLYQENWDNSQHEAGGDRKPFQTVRGWRGIFYPSYIYCKTGKPKLSE